MVLTVVDGGWWRLTVVDVMVFGGW